MIAYGRWSIVRIGFFRAVVNVCDGCNECRPLHKVRDEWAAYRDVLYGRYCLPCAEKIAKSHHAEDVIEHRKRVAQVMGS